MGVSTMAVPVGIGYPKFAKILARWTNLLNHTLSRNQIFIKFKGNSASINPHHHHSWLIRSFGLLLIAIVL